MNKPKISIIVAVAKNRAIGKNNQLLWHIPEDLKHFHEITKGHPVIMGRKTFESIGKPLSNRTNIIITQNSNLNFAMQNQNCSIANSLGQAIEIAKTAPGSEEIFVIGGGQIYEQAIGIADKLYLTIVEGNFDADTFFPEYSAFKKIISEEKRESSGYKYTFLELEK